MRRSWRRCWLGVSSSDFLVFPLHWLNRGGHEDHEGCPVGRLWSERVALTVKDRFACSEPPDVGRPSEVWLPTAKGSQILGLLRSPGGANLERRPCGRLGGHLRVGPVPVTAGARSLPVSGHPTVEEVSPPSWGLKRGRQTIKAIISESGSLLCVPIQREGYEMRSSVRAPREFLSVRRLGGWINRCAREADGCSILGLGFDLAFDY